MTVLNNINKVRAMFYGLSNIPYGLRINWIKHNSLDKFEQICIKNFLEKKSLT